MSTQTHWKRLSSQDFIGAYALQPGQDLTVKILDVNQQEVTGTGGKKQECVVATLEGQKPMILNATNCKTLERLFSSPYVEDWKGKQITLYVSSTSLMGEQVECLRIRPNVAKVATPKKPITSERFTAALEAVKAGAFDVNELFSKYELTAEQQAALQTLEVAA